MPDGVSSRTAGETASPRGPKRTPRGRGGPEEASGPVWLASALRARAVAVVVLRYVAVPLLCGLLLGRSIILGTLHPFGVAFVVTLAAGGRRGQALAAALGVFLAALTSPPGAPMDSPAAVLVFVWLFAALAGRIFHLAPWVGVSATMAGAATLRTVAAAFSGESIAVAAVAGAVDLTAAWVLLPVTSRLFGSGRAGGAAAAPGTGAASSALVFASLLLFGTGGLQWLGYSVSDILFRLFLLAGAASGGVGVGAAVGAFLAVLTLLGDAGALWEAAVLAAAGLGAGAGVQLVFAKSRSRSDGAAESPSGRPGTRPGPADRLLLRLGAVGGLIVVQLLLAALAPDAGDVRDGIAHGVLAGAGLVLFPEFLLERWRRLLRESGIGLTVHRSSDGSAFIWRWQLLRMAGAFDHAAASLAGDFGGGSGIAAATGPGWVSFESRVESSVEWPSSTAPPSSATRRSGKRGDASRWAPGGGSSPAREPEGGAAGQAAGLEEWDPSLAHDGPDSKGDGIGTEAETHKFERWEQFSSGGPPQARPDGPEDDVLGTRDGFERFVQDVRSQVCRGCSNEAVCWDEFGWKTYRDVLALVADVEPDAGERPAVSVSDLPPGLRQRCIQLQHFTQGVDGLLALVYDKARTERQIRRWQAPLQRQLSGLAEVIAGMAEEIRRMEQTKPQQGPESGLRAHPRFQIHTDSVQAPGDVTVVSGDSLLTAELPEDKVAFIVCDGMGSGARAAAESRAVAAMLRRFLEAGFDLRFTVQTINSVMLLRAQEDSFVTVDVTVVDLRDGSARIAKTGAAPTYIHRGDGVEMVRADSLPVGILPAVDVFEARVQLNMGDVIVMMSDGGLDLGASRGDKGEAVRKLLERIERPRPKTLVDGLFSRSRRLPGPLPDDVTIVAAQLVPAVLESASEEPSGGEF